MFGKISFRGGVHPPHNKEATANLSVTEPASPEKVIIPLVQHIGAPAQAAVKRGDHVKVGQEIGTAGGFVSSPVHASVSGKVLSTGLFPHPSGARVLSLEIENDGADEHCRFEPVGDWRSAAPGEIVRKIASCGIVGMGGASFPTHVKLSPPSDKPIDTLILNGAECEPYLTTDHRLMLEKPDEILRGALIVRKTLGARRVVLAVEDNKADVLKLMKEKAGSEPYEEVSVATLATKYPQGGEKQLIKALTGREVPSGGLPMDVGCVVQNVATVCAIREAVEEGVPLYRRVVTVTGPLVRKPANLLVRIGTPMLHLLRHCEADLDTARKVIMGGPMTGPAQSELEAPVIKATSGLLVSDALVHADRAYPCISCGNCVNACPIRLVPTRIAMHVQKENYDEAQRWNVTDCIECGCCSFVCPSKINLVHYMKLGKYHVTKIKKARAATA